MLITLVVKKTLIGTKFNQETLYWKHTLSDNFVGCRLDSKTRLQLLFPQFVVYISLMSPNTQIKLDMDSTMKLNNEEMDLASLTSNNMMFILPWGFINYRNNFIFCLILLSSAPCW